MVIKIPEANVSIPNVSAGNITPEELANFQAGNSGEWDVSAISNQFKLPPSMLNEKETPALLPANQAHIQDILKKENSKIEVAVQHQLCDLLKAKNPEVLANTIRGEMETHTFGRVATCNRLLEIYPTPNISETLASLTTHSKTLNSQKTAEIREVSLPESTYRVYSVIAFASDNLEKREGYTSQGKFEADVLKIKEKYPNPMDFYRATYADIEHRIRTDNPDATPAKQDQYKLALEVAVWAIYGEGRIQAAVQMENYLRSTYNSTARSKLESMTNVNNGVPIETFRDYLAISVRNMELPENVVTEANAVIQGFDPVIDTFKRNAVHYKRPSTPIQNIMTNEISKNKGTLSYSTLAKYLTSQWPPEHDQSAPANTRREALGVITALVYTVQNAQKDRSQREKVSSLI